jgi:Tol biopolymer transport system component
MGCFSPWFVMNPKPLRQFGRDDLRRILASAEFARSERMARFLTYLFEHSQDPESRKLKETEVGTAVFDRAVGYDPKTDSIVRVEATRLRKKLAAYYAGEGAEDPVRVALPVGRYELEFVDAPASAEREEAEPVAVEEAAAPQPDVPRVRRYRVAAAGVLLLGVAAIGLFAVIRNRPSRSPEVLQTIPLTALPGGEDFAALSRDGKRIAFVWDGESKGADLIYLGGWASERPVRLTTESTAAEGDPAWSADGREIAYLKQAGEGLLDLRIRRLADGAEESVTQVRRTGPELPGLSISPDGQWLATAEASGDGHGYRLLVVSRATHQKRFFHPVAGIPASRRKPVFSPDGKQVAFVESVDAASADVWVAGFPEGLERKVTHDNRPVNGLAWAPDGASLIVASYRERNRCGLWRIPLEEGRAPVRLTDPGMQAWNPAISENGRLVFSRHVDNINLWRLTGDSPTGQLWITSTGLNSTPRFSNDGRRLAFRSNRSGRSEIWLQDSGGAPQRLTHFDGPVTGSPRWSPDDRWIAFDSRRFGRADVFVVPSGGGEPTRLTDSESNESVPCWSPDGKYVYYASDREGSWSVWRKPAAAGGREELVRRRAFAPEFGNDGALYYTHGPNEPGLFRAGAGGSGDEETVLDDLQPGMWGNWAATAKSGLYYLAGRDDGSADLKRRTADGKMIVLGRVAHPVRWDGGLGVSPDGSLVVYASVDRSDSDLYWTDLLK